MELDDRDIFSHMARLREGLDRFSQAMWSDIGWGDPDRGWTPPVDIYEQDGALVLIVDLPGLRREDIHVTIDQDSLTLEGERLRAEAGAGIRLERSAGRFRRSFRIGVPVSPSGAEAAYRDGLLRIIIPRASRGDAARRRVKVD